MCPLHIKASDRLSSAYHSRKFCDKIYGISCFLYILHFLIFCINFQFLKINIVWEIIFWKSMTVGWTYKVEEENYLKNNFGFCPKIECGGDATTSTCSKSIRNERYRIRGSFLKRLDTKMFSELEERVQEKYLWAKKSHWKLERKKPPFWKIINIGIASCIIFVPVKFISQFFMNKHNLI